MKNLINPAYLSEEKIKEIHEQFQNAQPCRHVALPNFLLDDVANTLYENFQKLETLNVKRKNNNENKPEKYN